MKLHECSDRTTISIAALESRACHEPFRTQTPTPLDTRVIVAVTSHRNGKHDPDGISIKAVLDGLIKCGILRDDSTEQIQKICLRSKKAKSKADERTTIEIYNEGENLNAWC